MNRDFDPDVPQIKFRIYEAADHDGLYVVYKSFHAALDGLSNIKVLSRMQDGGVEADIQKGIKIPHRPELSWS